MAPIANQCWPPLYGVGALAIAGLDFLEKAVTAPRLHFRQAEATTWCLAMLGQTAIRQSAVKGSAGVEQFLHMGIYSMSMTHT